MVITTSLCMYISCSVTDGVNLFNNGDKLTKILKWNYEGESIQHHGKQLALQGDAAIDDCFGECTLNGKSGPDLIIEIIKNDGFEEKVRTAGHIRVVQQRKGPDSLAKGCAGEDVDGADAGGEDVGEDEGNDDRGNGGGGVDGEASGDDASGGGGGEGAGDEVVDGADAGGGEDIKGSGDEGNDDGGNDGGGVDGEASGDEASGGAGGEGVGVEAVDGADAGGGEAIDDSGDEGNDDGGNGGRGVDGTEAGGGVNDGGGGATHAPRAPPTASPSLPPLPVPPPPMPLPASTPPATMPSTHPPPEGGGGVLEVMEVTEVMENVGGGVGGVEAGRGVNSRGDSNVGVGVGGDGNVEFGVGVGGTGSSELSSLDVEEASLGTVHIRCAGVSSPYEDMIENESGAGTTLTDNGWLKSLELGARVGLMTEEGINTGLIALNNPLHERIMIALDKAHFLDISYIDATTKTINIYSQAKFVVDGSEHPIGACCLSYNSDGHRKAPQSTGVFIGVKNDTMLKGQASSFYAHYARPLVSSETRSTLRSGVSRFQDKTFRYGDVVERSGHPESRAAVVRLLFKEKHRKNGRYEKARKLLILVELFGPGQAPPDREPVVFPGSWCQWNRVAQSEEGWGDFQMNAADAPALSVLEETYPALETARCCTNHHSMLCCVLLCHTLQWWQW